MTFAKPTDTPGQPLNVIYAEHILQLIGVLTGQIDGGALQFLGQVAAPATAPTVTLSAGALNGSYEWGTYWITGAADGTSSYAVTGRTTPSPYSAAQALVNQQGAVSIAGQAVPTGVVGWGVVRNQASGGTWYEVPGSEQFMNNAGVMPTSFIDNVTDANLVTVALATNTTGTYLSGYVRTDSRAPSPQTVTTQVQFDSTVLLNAVSTGWVGQLQWLYNGALKHLFYIDQSNAYQLNLRMNYNNDGSSNTLSINGNVQTYGDITAEGSANQSADHPLSALSPDGSSIWLLPSTAQGAYNPLVQAGDQAIIFSNQGAPANTSYLTIAPWYGSSAGIRIGSDGSLAAINPTFAGVQVFTASGTFSVPTGVKRVFVQVWGAGGGGAQGAYNQQYGTCFGGGGGGGGGYAEGWIEVSTGQQITVTVGAGGPPGSGANGTQLNLGGTGGTSSFGSYVQATGGTGGYQSEAGTGQPLNATGGSGGLGNLGTYGATGNNGGGAGSNTTNGQNGGGGATSMAGPGGAGSTSTSTAGGNGYAPGGGGGGGYANPYTSVTAGGSGARGEVRVHY